MYFLLHSGWEQVVGPSIGHGAHSIVYGRRRIRWMRSFASNANSHFRCGGNAKITPHYIEAKQENARVE